MAHQTGREAAAPFGWVHDLEVAAVQPAHLAHDDEAEAGPVWPRRDERLEQVAERMTSAMDEIVKSHAGQTILVVGHGGSLRALFCQALGVPARAMLGFRLHNASLSVVEYGPQRASLALVNDVSHVPEPCHGAEPATDGKTGRLRR